MDVYARLIKLKPGSAAKVSTWAETINTRKDEALETLRAEGVEIESWFAFSLDGNDYLLCYMRSDSIARAEAVASESTHAIDEIHENFKHETWIRGEGVVGKLLVDLQTTELGE